MLNDKDFTKAQLRKIHKTADRYGRFMSRFSPGWMVPINAVKMLTKGMINDFETHPYFELHHKINERAGIKRPTDALVQMLNDRTKNN